MRSKLLPAIVALAFAPAYLPAQGAGTENVKTAKPAPGAAAHKATGVVKKIDPAKGTVTLAHDAVKSLNWPAMTMPFAVQDKSLFDVLKPDRKVEFEFVKRGSDYVITAAK